MLPLRCIRSGVVADTCRSSAGDTVYLCHDSDVDGQKAAVRIANKLTEQGINTEILVPIRKDWNEDLYIHPMKRRKKYVSKLCKERRR